MNKSSAKIHQKAASGIILGYGLIIGVSYTYQEPWFNWSQKHIPELQQIKQTAWAAWQLLTNSGAGVTQGIYILAQVLYDRHHQENIVLFVNLSVEIFVMTFLKLLSAQARPFWVFPEIRANSCILQFGNPSGHSLFASFFTMYLWHRHFYKSKLALKITSFVILATGFILLGTSRLVMGVHSLNQVFYGFQVGLWTCVACVLYIDPLVISLLQNQQNHKRGTVIAGALTFLSFVLSLVVFLIAQIRGDFQYTNQWKQNIEVCMLHNRHDGPVTVDEQSVKNASFRSTAAQVLGLGAICGSVYKQKYDHNPEFKLKSTGILVLILACSMAPYVILKWVGVNVIIEVLFGSTMSLFLFSFFLFSGIESRLFKKEDKLELLIDQES